MGFTLWFTATADAEYKRLGKQDPKKFKKVKRTLGYMETNLRHPSLNTHEFESMSGVKGERVYEAYVEQQTPGAYRVFWHYGPNQGDITVIAITPHS